MKTYNFEQRSPEWFAVRKGKMTASHAQEIQACGAGLKTYAYNIMAEYYSTEPKAIYTNADMERGNLLEPEACMAYEHEEDIKVEHIGFIEYNEYAGCSPDGMVEEDGLIEIKCHGDKKYIELLCEDKIDSKYVWQMQMQMLVTQRAWCDYVAYNPNFKERPLYVKRLQADPKAQAKLLKGFEMGEKLIREIKSKYNKEGN